MLKIIIHVLEEYVQTFKSKQNYKLIICLFGFYGISTFVGYLTPNPLLYK